MSEMITRSKVKRLAGLELNAILFSKILPVDLFQGAIIRSSGTPIYDINGEVLFYRIPVLKGRIPVAYADIAAHSVFGFPLLAVHHGLEWDAKRLLNEAVAVARKQHEGFQFDQTRFVAYSYPKIAVQFLRDETETLMLELFTWKPVPAGLKRKPEESPSNFERWSLIEETSQTRKGENLDTFRNHLFKWDDLCPPARPPRGFKPEILSPLGFKRAFGKVLQPLIDTRELHYSPAQTDHHPCYELRGQLTNVWCVAASVQMILDFYRYNYSQTRIAQELDLGTINNPNLLPVSRCGDVVTVLQKLTSSALNANMNTSPNLSEFGSEIRANRPLISFIPGHSRTVAGYANVKIFNWYTFRGLLVYDPWPPTTGVITRWENFDAQAYFRTFTAQLTLV